MADRQPELLKNVYAILSNDYKALLTPVTAQEAMKQDPKKFYLQTLYNCGKQLTKELLEYLGITDG